MGRQLLKAWDHLVSVSPSPGGAGGGFHSSALPVRGTVRTTASSPWGPCNRWHLPRLPKDDLSLYLPHFVILLVQVLTTPLKSPRPPCKAEHRQQASQGWDPTQPSFSPSPSHSPQLRSHTGFWQGRLLWPLSSVHLGYVRNSVCWPVLHHPASPPGFPGHPLQSLWPGSLGHSSLLPHLPVPLTPQHGDRCLPSGPALLARQLHYRQDTAPCPLKAHFLPAPILVT